MDTDKKPGIIDPNSWRRAAVIVAHPDDEVLWAGGTIIARPHWKWHIIALCRRSDPDRAPKFAKVLGELGASGSLGDLDDGPDQHPLGDQDVDQAILGLLPNDPYDLVLTHGPCGEYTRHRRHEETCRAVCRLWASGKIRTSALLLFAFEDGGRSYMPKVQDDAPLLETLSEDTWQEKYRLITSCYGFSPDSWEACATPHREAFHVFDESHEAKHWIDQNGVTT